jgi:hypothetical protein
LKVPVPKLDASAFLIAEEKLGLVKINLRLLAYSLGKFCVSLRKSKV